MGTLEVDKLDPQSGTALEIGTSGDTATVPSGVTLTVAGTLNVTGSITATDKIDSAHYAAGSIDNEHIADDAIDSEHYADGSIDTAHLGALLVTGAKLNTDAISAQTALTAEPADTDEFMVSDGGVLKRIDYSLIKGGGITAASQWRLTTDLTGNAEPISSNLEAVDTSPQGNLGSAMSVSSGLFTFPSTGFWWVQFIGTLHQTAATDYMTLYIQATDDNSSYNAMAEATANSNGSAMQSCGCDAIFDITNTTNCKVRFRVVQANTGNQLEGNSTYNRTMMTFIRLGDT